MVAAVVPVELDVDSYLDGAARLVAEGLRQWVRDAARGRACPWEATGGQLDAWSLIVCRPVGVPLVQLAAQLGGVDEAQVWEALEQAVIDRIVGG